MLNYLYQIKPVVSPILITFMKFQRDATKHKEKIFPERLLSSGEANFQPSADLATKTKEI